MRRRGFVFRPVATADGTNLHLQLGTLVLDPVELCGRATWSGRGFVPLSGMTNDNPTYPYTLTILPNQRLSGHFDWAIRKHGTLAERSDRPHPSEQSARKSGEGALERHLGGDREPTRAFQSGPRKRH